MMNGKNGSILTAVLVVAGLFIILVGFKFGAPVLGPIFLSFFFAIVLTPLLKWFTRRGLSYRSALVVTVIGIGILGIMVLALMAYSLIDLRDQLAGIQNDPDQTNEILTAIFEFLIANVNLSQVTTVLYNGVFVLFGTLFLLIELPLFHRVMMTRLGADHSVVRTAEELYRDIIEYFIVRIKVNFFTSLGVTAVLLVMGIDYALLWGILAFALSFVPYIGYLLAAIPPVLIGYIEFGLLGAVAVLLIYGFVNLIAENVVFPKLAGKALAVPVYVVFVSVFFWGWLLGVAGMLLSVPLTMAVVIFLGKFEETAWLVPFFRGERSPERKGLFRKKVP
jgi:predicted PurR-regulated permease PerM